MGVSFLRIKRSHGRDYVYLVESVRDRKGRVWQRYLRYVGPTDPAYGGRGPVDLAAEKEKLRNRIGKLD